MTHTRSFSLPGSLRTLAKYMQTTDEVPISGAKKTAPMPEGLSEVNDRNLSAGSSGPTQSGSGHGGNGPKEMGENKGLGMGPGNANV